MKSFKLAVKNFDLEKTLGSGQVFHWEKLGSGFCGTIGDRAVYVEQRDAALRIVMEDEASERPGEKLEGMPGPRTAAATRELVRHYFALDHPLEEICRSFPQDPVMDAARLFCRGLRIIRQPKWECLATFICSSMKQVSHIRQISHALRRRFGEKVKICDREVFSFPSPDRLARTSERELRRCALGYRAKNLLSTAKLAASGEVDLESWSVLSNHDLQKRLCEFPGVGAKVANCVMLFAFERIKAFPIDVWIERVLREKYFVRKRRITGRMLVEFTANYFGPHGGYAQQYLFHHARMTRKKGRRKLEGPNHEIT